LRCVIDSETPDYTCKETSTIQLGDQQQLISLHEHDTHEHQVWTYETNSSHFHSRMLMNAYFG